MSVEQLNPFALVIGWAVIVISVFCATSRTLEIVGRAVRDTWIDWLNARDEGVSAWCAWVLPGVFALNLKSQMQAWWRGYSIESIRRRKR